jgi:hypothetical protein
VTGPSSLKLDRTRRLAIAARRARPERLWRDDSAIVRDPWTDRHPECEAEAVEKELVTMIAAISDRASHATHREPHRRRPRFGHDSDIATRDIVELVANAITTDR